MNNAFFGKTMENVRKYRDFKLIKTQRRWDYLVSEPNYHTTKFFTDNLLLEKWKKKTLKNTWIKLCLFSTFGTRIK